MTTRTRVKICGITQDADAQLAAQLGAWAVGFIFYPQSPRFVAVERAAEIAARLPAQVRKVGVFVNESDEWVVEAMRQAKLDLCQLHGDEDAASIRAVRAAGFPVIRVMRANNMGDIDALSACAAELEAVLIDASIPGQYGGTGKLADWALAKSLKSQRKIILSGGLGPGNIAQAITEVDPYAVDVSSGVELRPGIKDPKKLEELFRRLPK